MKLDIDAEGSRRLDLLWTDERNHATIKFLVTKTPMPVELHAGTFRFLVRVRGEECPHTDETFEVYVGAGSEVKITKVSR